MPKSVSLQSNVQDGRVRPGRLFSCYGNGPHLMLRIQEQEIRSAGGIVCLGANSCFGVDVSTAVETASEVHWLIDVPWSHVVID